LPGMTFDSCAVAISDTKFLLIGGWLETTQVSEYDSETGSWETWPSLVQARAGHACARLGKTVIITGGHKDNTKAHLASTSLIDIDSKEERVGGQMLRGRTYHRMALLGRHVMVFGGLGEQDLGGRDVEAWFEEEQEWRLREDFRMTGPRLGFGAVSLPRSELCLP